MRIVFMGTPQIAAAALEGILASEHQVVGVFTQPDRPKGRGHKLAFSPVKEVAVAAEIPVFQPEKLRGNEEMLQALKDLEADVTIVVAYGQILPQSYLDAPKYGSINTHASLLPKLRGAAPIQRAIMNGDTVTGVTIMQMAAGLDTGDMLYKLELPIDDHTTSEELFSRMETLCTEGILATLRLIENGLAVAEKQDDSQATWAAPLTKEEGILDFSKETRQLLRQIHGCNPWPLAQTVLGGKKVKVCTAAPSDLKGKVGELLDKSKLIIGTGDGAIELLEVVPEGKKRMDGASLLNGLRLSKGELIVGG